MRIVCQRTILMNYHALFVIFEKAAKFENCCLLQIVGGALRVKRYSGCHIVQRSRTVWAIMVEGFIRNICVKLIFIYVCVYLK